MVEPLFLLPSQISRRMLLDKEDNSFGSDKLPLGSREDIRCLKRKIGEADFMAEPASSHITDSLVTVKSLKTLTPVKATQVTANWLRTVISPLPSKPSEKLQQMLVVNGKSVVGEVISRANIIVKALFPASRLEQRFVKSLHDINSMESLWSEQKCSEALKLYYRVLESVCESEAQKLNTSGLNVLLANESFHRCLISCSAELVSAAQIGLSMLLPVVFDRTGITAFDLSKVIECLIIHGPNLPRELRRHLNCLEEQLLESRVWEKGSSLYDFLIVARPSLSDEINRLELLAAPMPSLDAIALHNPVSFNGFSYSITLQKHNFSPAQDRGTLSPKRACSKHSDKVPEHNSPKWPRIDPPSALCSLQAKPAPASPSPSPSSPNALMSPTMSNAQQRRGACSDTAINILFSKMAKLAAIRIQSIAERLKLSQQFREKIYFLFQQILTQRTALFFNRHMDQIIVCCFYMLAKVSKLHLNFKQIINNYMKQPQYRSQVFHYVPSNHEKNGGQYVGIITFYNEIFVQNVKSLLDLEDIRNTEPPKQVPEIKNNDDSLSLHQMSLFPHLPDISPKKVSPSQNVYLSPLRQSKKDALNSNVTKSYYAFVGESTSPYESPSKQLAAINKCLNRTWIPKARCMLKFDDTNVAMISDDVVAKSLHFQNSNCP